MRFKKGYRYIAWILVLVMALSSATPVSAYEADKDGKITVIDKNGNTITEDESWESKYPNGTFAFKNNTTYVSEGKETKSQKMTVYRLGGTKGTATAYMSIVPAVASEDKEMSKLIYANAASNKDYKLEVENPSGEAVLGKKEVQCTYGLREMEVDSGIELKVQGVKGDYVRYFWQVKKDGEWVDFKETDGVLVISKEDYEKNDYMCIVEADYEISCSKSLKSDMSKVNVDVNGRCICDNQAASEGYTNVPLDTHYPYKSGFFQVDFQDGEWVKDIIITPVDDDEHESEELAAVTIYKTDGAAYTESANRSIVQVSDDEEVLDSEMGFDVKNVRVDKSTGTAKITVKRTGGIQYVASVDYKTEDGTAKSGDDYVSKSGTASFSGGYDEFTIEVDLINDKKVSKEDVYFTIKLSTPKSGTIKEDSDEIKVKLFNTNTATEDNTATKLKMQSALDATDLTKTASSATTENDNTVVVKDANSKKVEATYDAIIGDDDGNLTSQEVDACKHTLTFNSGGTWTSTLNLRDQNWSPGASNESANFAKVDGSPYLYTTRRSSMYINIPDMINRYSGLNYEVKYRTEKTLYWAYNYMSAVYGMFSNSWMIDREDNYTSDSGDGPMDSHINDVSSNGNVGNMFFRKKGSDADTKNGKTASGYVDIESNYRITSDKNYLVFRTALSKRKDNVRGREAWVKVLNATLNRRVLTENPTVHVYTADDDVIQTDINSGNPSFKVSEFNPVVALTDDAGTQNGKLFLGSSMTVTKNPNAGIYSIDRAEIIRGSSVISRTDGQSSSTLSLSSNNNRLEKNGYSMNIYQSRKQNLVINYGPSLLDDATAEENNNRITELMKNAVVTYKQFNNGSYTQKTEKYSDAMANYSKDTQNNTFTRSNLNNMQSINFNLSKDARILYNDHAYRGNENIPVAVSDFQSTTLTFQLYAADCVTTERTPKIISQNKVSLYRDNNNNNVIDSSDEKLIDVDANSEVSMEALNLDDADKQVLIAIDYTIQPACINAPIGKDKDATFSLVPSFTTSLTSEETLANLTEEQKAYRDIAVVNNQHKMYTDTTSGTIAIPVGGDINPATYDESIKDYKWTPEWVGNLLKDYTNPAEIKLYNTWMEDGFVGASKAPQINEYLGCLHGNETYVVTSRLNDTITSTSKGFFSTTPEPGRQNMKQDEQSNQQTDADKVETKGATNIAKTDPSVKMPSLNFSLGNLKYLMDDGAIGFSVGIPIFNATKETSTKGRNSSSKVEKKWTGTQFKDMFSDTQDALKKGDKNVFKQLKDQAKQYKEGPLGGVPLTGLANGDAKPIKSKTASIDISVNLTFMWEYSDVTGSYEFASAMVVLDISGEMKYQYRFAVCPIVYVYVTVGMEIEASSGIKVEKVEAEDGGEPVSKVSWAGIDLNVSLFVEAGAGVGIDIAKVEVYVKVSVSVSMTFGGEQAYKFHKFETTAAIGFRIVFLFINYEMDAIGCAFGYNNDPCEKCDNCKTGRQDMCTEVGAYFTWQAAGKEMGSQSKETIDGVIGAGVSVSLPQNRYRTQKVNSSEDNLDNDTLSSLAYDSGVDKFQVGGYGSSASAVALGENLEPASDYQLLTVGNTNYVLYMVSRAGVSGIHSTQLVLSKLTTTTKVGADGKAEDSMGLTNPVSGGAIESSYLVVDQDSVTGDVSFDSYVKDGKIYVDWTSYKNNEFSTEGMDGDEILNEASKHMETKSAVFDTATGTEFENVRSLSVPDANAVTGAGIAADELTDFEGYTFLPTALSENLTFFATTKNFTEAEMEERKADYQEYYTKAAEGNTVGGEQNTGDPYAAISMQNDISVDNLYGKYSEMNFVLKRSDGSYKTFSLDYTSSTEGKEWASKGVHLENMTAYPCSGKDNAYYLAYTTSEKDKSTVTDETDYRTIKRFFIQKVTVKNDEVVLGNQVLLKKLVDYNNSNDKDGEYDSEGKLVGDAFEAPTITGLKFLNGKLTNDGQKQDFLIYTLNGITYTINQSNLVNAVDATDVSNIGSITSTPLFETKKYKNTTDENAKEETEEGNSETDATIGVDAEGNVTVVYTNTVVGTTNNALYMMKYDPSLNMFGDPIMLAMNHMQVYEDSVSNGWSADEAKEAYYDTTKGGGMDKFIFASPQIALGSKMNNQETVTILSKGIFTKLTKTTLTDRNGDSYEEIIPSKKDGLTEEDMGVYALTFGIGEQSLSEESIDFEQDNFVPGAKLNARVSFRNSGDTAIRASESNKAVITLNMKDSAGVVTTLNKWNIESNVLPGQSVITEMSELAQLPNTEISGSTFYFEVCEDPGYTANGYSVSTLDNEDGEGVIQVGTKAELAIDNLEISTQDEFDLPMVNGEKCVAANINMLVTNKGAVDSGNLTLKVQRTDGNEDDEQTKYIPLELMGALATDADGNSLTDLGENGEYPWLNSSIAKGSSKKLSGKINIPISCFDTERANKSVNLSVSIVTSDDEYTKDNNTSYAELKPMTRFDMPTEVTLTTGNDFAFDLNATAASAQESNITLEEMPVNTDETSGVSGGAISVEEDKLFETLTYNPKTNKMMLRAKKEGTSIVRVSDTTTASYQDILVHITDKGINICKSDTSILTFDGKLGAADWEDVNVPLLNDKSIPAYQNDICMGKKDSTFTFSTYAMKLDLYFSGEIEVTSENSFGYLPHTYTGIEAKSGTDYFEPTTIDFGNAKLKKHTVTVKVLSDTASFDKYIEKYLDGTGSITREADKKAPIITFGKELDSAKKMRLRRGEEFDLPVYVYDNVALNSVSLAGNGAERKNTNFAVGTIKITKNGTYDIIAKDSSGHRTTETLEVNWFDENVTTEKVLDDRWPVVSAKVVNANGEEASGFVNQNLYLDVSSTSAKAISSASISYIDVATDKVTEIEDIDLTSTELKEDPDDPEAVTGYKTTGRGSRLSENGCYKIEMVDSTGRISRTLVYVNNIPSKWSMQLYIPSDSNNQLFYSVADADNEVQIKKVIIYKGNVMMNGSSIEIDGKEKVFEKEYKDGETSASGSINITNLNSSVFTIMAIDEAGQGSRELFDDKCCLQSMQETPVEGSDGEVIEPVWSKEFSPYVHEYNVTLPYGYPEDVIPELNPTKKSDEATVTENVETISKTDFKKIIKVSANNNTIEYVVNFHRVLCTCDIDLQLFSDTIVIPYDKNTVEKDLIAYSHVTECEVPEHSLTTQENLTYTYEIINGAEHAEVNDEGKITFKRFTGGISAAAIKVKVTADTGCCKESFETDYKLCCEYAVKMKTEPGGVIMTQPDQSESDMESQSVLLDSNSEGDYYIISNESLPIVAEAKRGYTFVGWKDKDGNTISTENAIDYAVNNDSTLIASFLDTALPYGEVVLYDQNAGGAVTGGAISGGAISGSAISGDAISGGAISGSAISGSSIQYSSKGFEAIINASDDESGVKSVEYQIVKKGDQLDSDNGWIPYANGDIIPCTEDMDFEIYSRIIDETNNQRIIRSNEAMVDNKGVTVQFTPSFKENVFTNQQDATVGVTVNQNITPIKKISYEIDGTKYDTSETEFTLDQLPDGDYNIVVYTTDDADNEVSTSFHVKKDVVAPTIDVTGNPTKLVRSAKLTIDTDCGVSGLKQVTVNGTKVTGNTYTVNENGTYVFEVTNNAGSKTTKTVNVTNLVNKVKSIKVPRNINVEQNGKIKISYLVRPLNATYKQVKFTSSKKSIATVNAKGVIQGKKLGTTTITIRSKDRPSIKAKIKVKVKLPNIDYVRTIKSSEGKIIAWMGVEKAVAYDVYSAAKKNGKYKKIARVKESMYLQTKSGKYYYKVVAVSAKKGFNSSLVDNQVTKTGTSGNYANVKQLASCNLKATTKSNKVILKWNKVKGATEYVVYRSESKYGILKKISSGKKLNFTDKKTDKGKTYYYKVRALKTKKGVVTATSISDKAVVIIK